MGAIPGFRMSVLCVGQVLSHGYCGERAKDLPLFHGGAVLQHSCE